MRGSNFKRLKVATLITAAVMLAACASEQPQEVEVPAREYTQAERLEAAQHVLSESVKLRTIAQYCQRVDEESAAWANGVHGSWVRRHWPYLDAADREMRAKIAARQAAWGEERGMLPLLKLVMDARLAAEESIASHDTYTHYPHSTCRRALRSYDGSDELARTREQRLLLEHLREHHAEAESRQPRPVPELDSQFFPQRDVGNELEEVEQLAGHLCKVSDVINLQAGLLETYAIFCADGPPHLVDCLEGDCQLRGALAEHRPSE